MGWSCAEKLGRLPKTLHIPVLLLMARPATVHEVADNLTGPKVNIQSLVRGMGLRQSVF